VTGLRSATTDNVLVVAAHPDDEVLGCGGTIARHVRAGHSVTVVIVCSNAPDRRGPYGTYDQEQPRAAVESLGVSDLRQLAFADQSLDTIRLTDLVGRLTAICRQVRPGVVYSHHGRDVNRDHQVVSEATLVATRPTESCIRAVYAFDTASSTEWGYPRTFVADTWIDIEPTLPLKLEAMTCYRSELRDWPHPRSRDALAHRARATGSQVCLGAAEAFMTIRRIVHGDETVL